MSPSASFLSLLTRYRSTVLTLAAWELRSRYAGTLGGILWSLVSPAALILVYWLVFEVGFRAQGTHGLPFIVWFITGIVPWMTFSEIVNNSAHTITANTHLVKKTVFPVELLPLVNVTTVLGLHLVLLVILGGVLLYYRVPFTAATLQLPYFLFGLACLSLGLSWLVSAVTVFFRDFSQVIGVLLNVWFWLTPIVWPPTILPDLYQPLIQYNPVAYIVQGYRRSLLFGEPFWSEPLESVSFWIVALISVSFGLHIFRRLRPDFADVL